MTEKTLEQRIIRELQKTGYPTEMVAASTMQHCGWAVTHSPSYRDDVEGINREFDIRAYRDWSVEVPPGSYRIGVYLIAECKKSQKPWVFFCTPEQHNGTRLGELLKATIKDVVNVFTGHSHSQSVVSDDTLREFHHYFQHSTLARTFYEPFKGKEATGASPTLYSAVLSSIKATLFYYLDESFNRWLRLFYPLVVFDGDMFEARVLSKGEIDLTRSDHVQLSFSYMLPATTLRKAAWRGQHRFIVDIVHISYLETFLQGLEVEHVALANCLQEGIASRED